jgi:CheY-like chemotaxis protein
MPVRHKILLVDDEQDTLQLYKELLRQLPSQPEIYTATSGVKAIALLESEPFSLLISDLSMPKMDGLQVLSIVRRKFPQLRTAVLTCVTDEQFRTRAYAIGVDIFLEKPGTPQEIQLFMDCIESLLGREAQGGFRGLQSKSLVDIVQLECLSQSSSVLRVTNGPLEGRIWFQDGEIVHAATQDLTGEPAFYRILSWKTGNFESLPAQPGQPRTIHESHQALLLKAAQAQDEAKEQPGPNSRPLGEAGTPSSASDSLAEIPRLPEVEFILTTATDGPGTIESWGVENPERVAAWAREMLQQFEFLGDRLQAGNFNQIEGFGLQNHVTLAAQPGSALCVGFQRQLSPEHVRDIMKTIVASWVS